MDIENAINFEDLRKLAKKRLPKVVYDFIEGGADDEDGLLRNEDAFRSRPWCRGIWSILRRAIRARSCSDGRIRALSASRRRAASATTAAAAT